MEESQFNPSLLVMVIGGLVVLSMFAKSVMEKINLPDLVAYMVIGFALRMVNEQFAFLGGESISFLELLADLGVIVLLFHVGLHAKIKGLLRQLRSASFVCLTNLAACGLIGYFTARYLLSLELIPSLIVATAMTATSVGITAVVWSNAGKIDTEDGERLIDVAELDDISGVILLTLLFSILPILRNPGEEFLAVVFLQKSGIFIMKFVIFAGLCIIFSLYIEKRYTEFFRSLESEPIPMLVVAGTCLIIAAAAGLLGFSVAIGAFFAGLSFSRDPKCVREDAEFDTLYEFFAPFFFIGIGYHIAPASLGSAGTFGLVLLGAAITGKIIGNSGGWMLLGVSGLSALTLGVSMIPRAEITMVIMQKGLQLGDWAVPPSVYSGMVLVSMVTSILGPLVIRYLLKKWE